MRINHDVYYCENLIDNWNENIELIKSFRITRKTGIGLERYLKEFSFRDELNGFARTYLVKDSITDELVGYFTLQAGKVAINVNRFFFHIEHDEISAVELSNFAVNDAYRINHTEIEGLGELIFYYFVLPVARKASEYVGIHLIYIFALPYDGLVRYYESLHFSKLSSGLEGFIHRYYKPRYDQGCVFMSRPLDTE